MIANKDFALSANKFYYYFMNYRNVEITYPSFNGDATEYLPEFFNAFPKHLISHLWGKYLSCCETFGTRGGVLAFYGELDNTMRGKLLYWVNEHYNEDENFGICLPE